MAKSISVPRGDSVTLNITATDQTTGDPINLTGKTVFFTVKQEYTDDDTSALISKEVTSHTDPTHGKTQIAITSTDTDVEPGQYYFDFQVLSGSDVNHTEIGEFEIAEVITRRTT